MRIYSYDRTSVFDEKKLSNEAQWTRTCKRALEDYGIEPQRYSDKGLSGGNENREAFQQLKLAIASSDSAGILYVWRYDRLSRDTRVALEFVELCQNHNVEIISIAEPLPSTANNLAAKKMFIQLLFINASMQRETTIENVRNGLAYKRSQNKYISSSVPFGYRLVNGKVIQEPTESKAVKRLFELYCSGEFGYKKLTLALLDEGYYFKDQHFKTHHIQSILNNSLYYGWIKGGTFGGYQGDFDPIIDKNMFDQAQAIRQSRHVKKTDKREYPLRKKIVCPYCQRRLSPKFQNNNTKTKRHYYYHCANRECKGIFINAEQIENVVIDNLRNFLQQKGIFTKVLAEVKQKINQMKKTRQMEKRIVHRNKTAIIEQFEKGELTIEEMKKELGILEKSPSKAQSDIINNYEAKLQELLLLKEVPIQQIILEEVASIEVNPDKEIQGIYLISIGENIIRKVV
ncbi:hypothetical protein A5819_000945 [Enterococcus sp. 7E2_DIV0204]|uniref:recombinase family protein n=1 Tax=unclassified Enterococcus TaxID=2608891 RepID=UPI000A337763|nr:MULTISPECIES: recombinase family protein [unclassified Enterococcus]OTN88464.1 hypothetical protein A5819_000945 [Enterococcus sp. 7E2_DIV0204]OTP50933.1 hypothetical protein A5884_000119 [Enterococcus sp. 7D2_DIV0200]